jgi:hypothetical protein
MDLVKLIDDILVLFFDVFSSSIFVHSRGHRSIVQMLHMYIGIVISGSII